MKESVWLIIVHNFSTVGDVKFLQTPFFVIFVGEELIVFGFVRGEYEKKTLKTTELDVQRYLFCFLASQTEFRTV